MAAYSGLGMQIAQAGAEWDTNTLKKRLSNLAFLGINKVRVNIPIYTTENNNVSFRNTLRNVCTTALNLGFYVIWGYTFNGSTVTVAHYTDFDTQMKNFAVWAQSVGLSEICLGNEEDLRNSLVGDETTKQTSLMNLQIQTAIDIKNAGYTGVISPTITTNVYALWKANVATWQDTIVLCVNQYNTLAAFTTNIADMHNNLPTQAHVGEFNSNGGRNDWSNDQQWENDVKARYEILNYYGIPGYYYFCYSASGADTQWSIYRLNSNQETTLFRMLGRTRRNFVNI